MNQKYTPEFRTRKVWAGWIFIALLSALLLNSLAGEYFKILFFNLITVLTPIFIGLFIAFVLKKLLNFLEKKVFFKWFEKMKNGQVIKRLFCITLLFILMFAFLYVLLSLVIPEIASFVNLIRANSSTYVQSITDQLTEFFSGFGWFDDSQVRQTIIEIIESIGQSLSENIPIIADSISTLIRGTSQFILYILIGFIIAFLLLKNKEQVSSFSRRLTNATFNKKRANRIIEMTGMAEKILYDYLSSKAIEACCIFLLMIPGFLLLGVPYAIAMAVVLALFNVIPYVGCIIAMIPITILTIIFVDVSTAIWVLVYLNVILALFGNFVTPFIFGKKLKVSPLVLIIALLIFGGLFGLWGMLIGPPLVAILWVFLLDYINKKENENLELAKHNLTRDDIKDLEILEEAMNIVKARREKEIQSNQNLIEQENTGNPTQSSEK